MKRLNSIENILLIFVVLFPLAFSNLSPKVNPVLSSYIERKCHDHHRAASVNSRLHELTSHLDRAFDNVPHNMDQFCRVERTHLINRMRNVAQKLRHCVPHDEAYLPQFAGQTFVGFLHFMCHNHSEHMQVLYRWKTDQPVQCWHRLLSYPVSSDVENCFYDIVAPTHGVSRHQMCSNLFSAKACIDGILSRECPHFPVVTRLNERLFKDLTDPCLEPSKQRHKFSVNGASAYVGSEVTTAISSLFALLLTSVLPILILRE